MILKIGIRLEIKSLSIESVSTIGVKSVSQIGVKSVSNRCQARDLAIE